MVVNVFFSKPPSTIFAYLTNGLVYLYTAFQIIYDVLASYIAGDSNKECKNIKTSNAKLSNA